jgi:aldehyde dehydrogenase (NAD+)
MVYHELSLHIKKLKSWARPTKVATPIIAFPSKSYIHKQPYGRILVISPFNYPFSLAIMPLLAAVSAGNVVVLKPSEYTPSTSNILEEIIKETFEKKHVAVVNGGIEESKELLAQRWVKYFLPEVQKLERLFWKQLQNI